MSNKNKSVFLRAVIAINIFSILFGGLVMSVGQYTKASLVNNSDFALIQKVQLSQKPIVQNSGEIKVNAAEKIAEYGEFVPGQILVKFKDTGTKKSFMQENTGKPDRTGESKTVLELPKTTSLDEQKKDTI